MNKILIASQIPSLHCRIMVNNMNKDKSILSIQNRRVQIFSTKQLKKKEHITKVNTVKYLKKYV